MDFHTISQTALIDDEQINMLIETGEDAAAELIQELLDLFVEEAEPRLDSLQNALQTGDAGTAARDAHAIAGASANLGAQRLSKGARMLEHALKEEKNPAELIELLAYLRGCYKESVELFNSQISRLQA